MNFFDCELKKEADNYYAYIGSAKVALPMYISEALKKRGNVPAKAVLGVRPENLILCADGTPNSVSAEIKVTEMMGSELHIHASCELGKDVILRVQIADMTDEEQTELIRRKKFAFTLRERTVNVFDPEDGRNLAVENAVAVPKKQEAPADGLITIDDFGKVKLQVVEIVEAEPVPKADKLLKLIVDTGTEKRQVVSGIAKHYEISELIGKRVILVMNLKPAKLRGVESQGMILAATKGDELEVVTVDMPVGSIVR
jgi:methionyl-tRNA synthetase